jgi:hypothetical protein
VLGNSPELIPAEPPLPVCLPSPTNFIAIAAPSAYAVYTSILKYLILILLLCEYYFTTRFHAGLDYTLSLDQLIQTDFHVVVEASTFYAVLAGGLPNL